MALYAVISILIGIVGAWLSGSGPLKGLAGTSAVVINVACIIPLGIFPASGVRVSAGISREQLRPCGQTGGSAEVTPSAASPVRTDIKIQTSGVKARFVQIDVRSIGTLPTCHPAAGQKAWLFIDNIMVNPNGIR